MDSDLKYRYQFLADFIDFGPQEIDAIHQAAPRLVSELPRLVDAVYVKMFESDITKKQFVPRHLNYDGPLAEDLAHLSLDDGQVVFRKERLIEYFTTLLTAEYLDAVGKMHTTKADGSGSSIHTPLMLINIMLGYIEDLFITEVLAMSDMDSEASRRTIRALNKLLWIQQSFISRHYV